MEGGGFLGVFFGVGRVAWACLFYGVSWDWDVGDENKVVFLIGGYARREGSYGFYLVLV